MPYPDITTTELIKAGATPEEAQMIAEWEENARTQALSWIAQEYPWMYSQVKNMNIGVPTPSRLKTFFGEPKAPVEGMTKTYPINIGWGDVLADRLPSRMYGVGVQETPNVLFSLAATDLPGVIGHELFHKVQKYPEASDIIKEYMKTFWGSQRGATYWEGYSPEIDPYGAVAEIMARQIFNPGMQWNFERMRGPLLQFTPKEESLIQDMRRWLRTGSTGFQVNPEYHGVEVPGPGGTVSSERTITIEMDGMYYNIPTLVGGEQLTTDEAVRQFKEGKIPAVGVADTREAAVKGAQERSGMLGGQ